MRVVFFNREEIKRVSGMGPKSFEQSAGFLRINHGNNPLDATAIHPESYPSALNLFELLKINIGAPLQERITSVAHFKQTHDLNNIAKKLEIGLPTLEDILGEIVQPGRDPREDTPKPLLRKDVLHLEDLVQGMILKGTIRNVVDFGAFVDIGLKTDGLLHRSRIKRNSDLKVGEIIDVIILSIDQDRNRIALDIKEK